MALFPLGERYHLCGILGTTDHCSLGYVQFAMNVSGAHAVDSESRKVGKLEWVVAGLMNSHQLPSLSLF